MYGPIRRTMLKTLISMICNDVEVRHHHLGTLGRREGREDFVSCLEVGKLMSFEWVELLHKRFLK